MYPYPMPIVGKEHDLEHKYKLSHRLESKKLLVKITPCEKSLPGVKLTVQFVLYNQLYILKYHVWTKWNIKIILFNYYYIRWSISMNYLYSALKDKIIK